jgi:hypothetical protein
LEYSAIAFPFIYVLSQAWLAIFNPHLFTYINELFDIQSAKRALPVILATANPPGNTESLRLAAVLRKPFTMAVLKRTVDDALRLRLPAGASHSLTRLARRLLALKSQLGRELRRDAA